ncbi:MAG: type I 3-dehydroquinate dehydratase [Nitrospirae bacterium]|nr:type I 3-dehydroquinate dehydratase [Nitrospirota bacterium]
MATTIGRFTFNVQFPVAGVYTGKGTEKMFPTWRSWGPDLVEVRLDHFDPKPLPEYLRMVQSLKAVLPCPFLLTVRSNKEGGGPLSKSLDDKQRYFLFDCLAEEVEGIDVELASLIAGKVAALCAQRKKTLVVSVHDFKRTPPDSVLISWLKKAKSAKADVVKIACHAASLEDALRLLNFALKNRKTPLVAIPMGDLARPLRLLAPLFGSRWAYAYLDSPTAPGQYSLPNFRDIARRL